MARASIGDYVVTSKLGSGSFAVVYKGYHKESKTPVAIKALSLGKLNSKLLANLEMEIAIMRQIDHPNVVKLYEIKKTDKHMYLMLEYCAGGDLQQYMRRRQQVHKARAAPAPSSSSSSSRDASAATLLLGEHSAQHFLRELAKGMQCLWQHNLIHRDLKPQNLLLVEDSPTSALKIADFGFARHLATASLAETLCGSPLYMAPEILKFQKYDAKADLWSVGTILFEMVAGRPPYGGANHVQLLANIERQPLRFPPGLQLSRACRHLLSGLLQRKPALRLGFAEFFADPFVDLPPAEAPTSSVRLSTAALVAPDSIQEEEESGPGHWGATRASTSVQDADGAPMQESGSQRDASSDWRARAFSVSHDASTSSSTRFSSTAPSAALRHSRSGNLEVMQTAFASTSSGAMRRSSTRLARSRRATSSGSGFGATATGTSPRLSPQMSPSVLPNPSPSPRINPFKQLAESPPGAAALQHSTALSTSSRGKVGTPATTGSGAGDTGSSGAAKMKVGTGPALDSSGEYVLIDDDGSENAATSGAPTLSTLSTDAASGQAERAMLGQQSHARATPGNAMMPAFSAEYGQQLVDIVLLRAQAITPIAEQLWTLSAAGVTLSSEGEGDTGGQTRTTADWTADAQASAVDGSALSASGGGATGPNFSSVFSMSSSLASSAGGGHAFGEEDGEDGEDDEDADAGRRGKRQYVCAAEALALYVKCLRLVQHGVLYLRQDPALASSRGSAGSSSASPSPPDVVTGAGWSEQSRKMSLAFLTEQLTVFLARAEQCQARMTQLSRVCATSTRAVASQDELLYAHALRLGRQGAIREVLGQSRAAHDHYLQALLLLESLLMETGTAKALAVDDQKSVATFLRALEQRLKNVRVLLEDGEHVDSGASASRRLQPSRQPTAFASHRATAAVL